MMIFVVRRWRNVVIALKGSLILLLLAFGCGDPDEAVVSDEEEKKITVGLLYASNEWEDINSLIYSPDGEVIAVGAGELDLFCIVERQVIRSGKNLEENRPESQSLSFSPNGSILAAAWRGVGLYDADDLTMLRLLHGGRECRVAYSPDGKTLATHPNQMRGEVWLWQSENGIDFEKVAEFDPDGDMIHAIAFTPDGKYLAGGFRDGKVRFWDVEARELAFTLDLDSHGGNYNLTFTPDGKTLAASEPDLGRKIYLLNLDAGTRERVLEPDGRVSSMEFSPDGHMLAYGRFDGTVEILNTKDWTFLYSLEHNDTIRGLSFSPDSAKLAVGTGAGGLYKYQIVQQ